MRLTSAVQISLLVPSPPQPMRRCSIPEAAPAFPFQDLLGNLARVARALREMHRVDLHLAPRDSAAAGLPGAAPGPGSASARWPGA